MSLTLFTSYDEHKDLDYLHQDGIMAFAYPYKGLAWLCRQCDGAQTRTVSRCYVHLPAQCNGGLESRCWYGPICPQCAEGPKVGR